MFRTEPSWNCSSRSQAHSQSLDTQWKEQLKLPLCDPSNLYQQQMLQRGKRHLHFTQRKQNCFQTWQDYLLKRHNDHSRIFLHRGWWNTRTECPERRSCLIPGNIQGQIGWGSDQCGLVEDVPVHCREAGLQDFQRSLAIQSILRFCETSGLSQTCLSQQYGIPSWCLGSCYLPEGQGLLMPRLLLIAYRITHQCYHPGWMTDNRHPLRHLLCFPSP